MKNANDPRSDEHKHPDGNEDDGITDLAAVKEWIKEKYPMRGHKTGEMIRSLVTEVELLRLATKQLEATAYHTPPGHLEYAPEGWTWKQQCRCERDRYAELEAATIDQSNRYARLLKRCRELQSAWTPLNIANTPFAQAAVEVILATSDLNAVADNA